MSENSNQDRIDQMRQRMANIENRAGSKSMCMAKWTQSTVYLMNGFSHSCHHPAPHKIPLDEIKNNPSALHNTQHKMRQRELMLKGERPPECQYCWNIEDLGEGHISDRVYKSTDESWSYPHLEKVLASREGAKIQPTYLEVAFDHACNMKCMYCTPDISSKWMEESLTFGPYTKTSHQVGSLDNLKAWQKMPIGRSEENPYVEAFWKWWPELYPGLNTFRITGGEPLLSANTWRVLEEIERNPKADLTLAINSNLQVPQKVFDKFVDAYNRVAPLIKSFEVFTSCEAHGAQAEYIRTGMIYESFFSNVREFLRRTGSHSRMNMMIAFNVLSMNSFDLFLRDILAVREEFNPSPAHNRLPMMINYIRWPQFQDVRVAPLDVKRKYFARIKDTVASFAADMGTEKRGQFYLEEMDQIERLGHYMMGEAVDLPRQLKDFTGFYREYDRRRGGNFPALFPELSSLY